MELKEEGNYRKLRLATAAAHGSADGQKHLFNSPYDARSSKGRLRTVAVSSLPGKWNSDFLQFSFLRSTSVHQLQKNHSWSPWPVWQHYLIPAPLGTIKLPLMVMSVPKILHRANYRSASSGVKSVRARESMLGIENSSSLESYKPVFEPQPCLLLYILKSQFSGLLQAFALFWVILVRNWESQHQGLFIKGHFNLETHKQKRKTFFTNGSGKNYQKLIKYSVSEAVGNCLVLLVGV
nr:protein PBDC1 isoform X1 [Camelus dromedarius]